MSDLDLHPDPYACAAADAGGPEELLVSAHKVWLGRSTQVARALPSSELRMVGAWCFLDHYGPEDVTGGPGMQVWAHPHTGLQTVSWLLAGEVEHRDGLGSRVRVRPGELHIMTAGHGIVHSEISPPHKPAVLHGLQLWVALPDAARDGMPRFRSYESLPRLDRPGVRGQVLIGELDGVRSPAIGVTPLCAADLDLTPGATLALTADPQFEYAVFVVAGSAEVETTLAGVDDLVYLGTGREQFRLAAPAGARLMVLGGEPFPEELVMWWNFVGRSHAEIVAFREAWLRRDPRFAPVADRDERVMEAPALPNAVLKPRPRRPAR